jgi:hypothetical protein
VVVRSNVWFNYFGAPVMGRRAEPQQPKSLGGLATGARGERQVYFQDCNPAGRDFHPSVPGLGAHDLHIVPYVGDTLNEGALNAP